MPQFSSHFAAFFVIVLIIYALCGIWNFVIVGGGRDRDPVKCSNKSLQYVYSRNSSDYIVNGTRLSSTFLPEASPRRGLAVYTVFCGTSSNKANVVAIPALPLPHYFLTDNDVVGKTAESRGWNYVKMFGTPDDDEIHANMKCKLPRTLPNLFGNLDHYKYLVYVDSKRSHTLNEKSVVIDAEITKMHRLSTAVVMNGHNFIKGDIWEEFEVATQHQDRYKKHRADYQKYIETRLQSSTLSGNKLMCGCFSIRDMDHPMTSIIGMNWYAEILKSGIEDQISLSFVYDRYKEFISLTNQTIGW